MLISTLEIVDYFHLVKVKDGEVGLKYFMPALPDKAAIDKEGILPIVPYGGRYCTIGGTFELVFNLV